MLSEKQITWLNHLSDTDKIQILPFNPKAKKYFQQQKKELQNFLGNNVKIFHRGASNMKISGQGDIDIYIPVPVEHFNEILEKLKQQYRETGSHYPKERAKFNRYKETIKIEIFLINKSCKGWITCNIFENYLKNYPEALEEYRKLKEDANGASTKEYYRRKNEFINEILELTSHPRGGI